MAILPESLARSHADDLHTVVTSRPVLRGHLALAWRTAGPVSPAARALIRHARDKRRDIEHHASA